MWRRITAAKFVDGTGESVSLAAFQQLFQGASWPTIAQRRGRPARVPLLALLSALIFHLMHTAGTLSEHFGMLFEDALCDSACSERRARLPWQVFSERMRRALRPLAQARRDAESFWRGWRLLALDGTPWSLSNTPQNQAQAPKAQSRRGRAAFAKIVTGVLLEVGWPNPLAAAIGHKGQSEWQLALSLLAQLPKKALLLADRLHGCAAFAVEVLGACRRVGSHFLIRARPQIKTRPLRRFQDGSRLVRVAVRQKGKPRVILQWLELRQIRVRVSRKGARKIDFGHRPRRPPRGCLCFRGRGGRRERGRTDDSEFSDTLYGATRASYVVKLITKQKAQFEFCSS